MSDDTFFEYENAKTGEERKRLGMKLAADAKPISLEEARRQAVAVCKRKGWATSDDIEHDLGNAAGSIFKDKRFKFSGKRIKSKKKPNHGRELKVWVLSNGA